MQAAEARQSANRHRNRLAGFAEVGIVQDCEVAQGRQPRQLHGGEVLVLVCRPPRLPLQGENQSCEAAGEGVLPRKLAGMQHREYKKLQRTK